jgi:hypothetical protein
MPNRNINQRRSDFFRPRLDLQEGFKRSGKMKSESKFDEKGKMVYWINAICRRQRPERKNAASSEEPVGGGCKQNKKKDPLSGNIRTARDRSLKCFQRA